MDSKCCNCGSAGVLAYCPNCGQEQTSELPTVSQWVGDAVDELFTLSGRLPRSLRRLLAPGELTCEWIEGRRAQYTRPFRLYLLSIAVLLVVSELLTPGDGAIPHGEWFLRGIYIAMVPVLAVAMRLAFSWGAGTSLVPEIVFSLHYHAFVSFALTMSIVAGVLLKPLGSESAAAIGSAVAGLGMVYFILAARRTHGRGWLATLLRGTLALSVYSALAGGGAYAFTRFLRNIYGQ